MYFISIIAVIAAAIWMYVTTGVGYPYFAMFLDLPSLIGLVILIFPLLISGDALKDLVNAFSIIISKNKEITFIQLKKSREAVDFTIKIIVVSTILLSVFSLIVSAWFVEKNNVETLYDLVKSTAVSLLPIVYSAAAVLLLIPVKTRINRLIIEFIQE